MKIFTESFFEKILSNIENKNPEAIIPKIILGIIDNFEIHKNNNGMTEYYMDFIFKENLDVDEFLEKFSLSLI